MKHKGLILGLCLAGFVSDAQAQIAAPKAAHRQHRQHVRIAEGRATGELTRFETHQLRKQQRGLRCHKRASRADGHISMRERAAIQRHQNKASRNIYHKKHNARQLD